MANRFTAKIGAVPRRVAQRFGWGLADQAMSSLSNAAMSFYVARELGASRFGAFSLAYVTYSFMLTASRGLATDPADRPATAEEFGKFGRPATPEEISSWDISADALSGFTEPP